MELRTLALAAGLLVGAGTLGALPPQMTGVFPLVDQGPAAVPFRTHVLQEKETVSEIAGQTGLDPALVLAFNHIDSPRLLRPGTALRLPDQNGRLIQVEEPTRVRDLAAQYSVFPDYLRFANRWTNGQEWVAGTVFLPGAKYTLTERRALLGELFLWPTKGGHITSYFGRRNDPFTGVLSSHSGLDIGNYTGAPVLAAREGVVVSTGYDRILGNHIKVKHSEGYLTVYGHLSKISIKAGTAVKAGQYMGRVGSTGYSTGPHLHFAAYHWNRLLDPLGLFD